MSHFRTDFFSYTLKRAVTIDVIVPGYLPSDDPSAWTHKRRGGKYPVLYLLNGYGGHEGSWQAYTSVERYAEEHGVAVVMPPGENSFYLDYGKLGWSETWQLSPAYDRFIGEEVPEFVKANFAVSSRPDQTYLAGLSMGGWGTLILGLSHPERYRALGLFSPVTTLRRGFLGDWQKLPKKIIDTYEPVRILDRDIKKGKKLPAIWYSYGDKDFLLSLQDAFEADLKERGIPHVYRRRPGFCHEWKLWDEELLAFLDWIPRTDSYASGCGRV